MERQQEGEGRGWLLSLKVLMLTLQARKRLRQAARLLDVTDDLRSAVAPQPLPKTIWIYWDKGEAEAPELVRFCIGRWRAFHPDWTVEVLDREQAERHVDMSDLHRGVRPAHYADVLRLRLLKRGGVWADATCLPMRPLHGWLPPLMQGGFFAFASPSPEKPLSNWFLAATPGSLVVDRWEARATGYWRGRQHAHVYTWPHYLFAWLLRHDADVRSTWEQTPKLDAGMAHLLKRALTGKGDCDETLRRIGEIGPAGFPLFKLTWKKGSLVELEELLGRIES